MKDVRSFIRKYMPLRMHRHFFVVLFTLSSIYNAKAQSVTFDLKTNPSVDFTFNTIEKYLHGIIMHDAVILDIVAVGTQWDLYVGSSTAVAGTWDNIQYYSGVGNSSPPMSLLQVQF